MSDGFIPVKSKNSRRQRQHQRKKPAPPHPKAEPKTRVEDGGWGAWNGQGDDSAWFQPKSHFGDSKAWEEQGWVDGLDKFIPFWLDNICAAERGEEMKKYADFLDSLYGEEDGWETGQDANPWGVPDYGAWSSEQDNADGWGHAAGGWGQVDESGWGQVNVSGWGEAGKAGGDGVETTENASPNDGWDTKGWENSYDPWAPAKASCDEWAQAFNNSDYRPSDDTARHDSGRGSADETTPSFVRKVARKQKASQSRVKSMETFYSVSAEGQNCWPSLTCMSRCPPLRRYRRLRRWSTS